MKNFYFSILFCITLFLILMALNHIEDAINNLADSVGYAECEGVHLDFRPHHEDL